MKRTLLLLWAVLWATSTVAAAPPPATKATVTRIADADTFWVKPAKGPEIKLRVHWADGPEKNQPGGTESIAFATKHLLGKEVSYLGRGKSYDRTVADVWEADGDFYAQSLAAAGHAWIDANFKPGRRASAEDKRLYAELVAAQAKAKADKIGLWALPNPIEPRVWRAEGRSRILRRK